MPKRLLKISSINSYKTILIIVTVLVIAFLFPRQAKFKFEYQKGKPWLHEVLIAPFDFPIYKLDSELAAEKDSILQYVNPYFNYNSKIQINQKALFREYFNKYWTEYHTKRSLPNDSYKELIFRQIIKQLDIVYQKGIIELPDEMVNFTQQSRQIIKVHDKIADEIDINELFTQKSAYEFIRLQLNNYNNDLIKAIKYNTTAFFSDLAFEKFLVPNLKYDEITTKNVRENLIKNISLSRGLMQAGERIIFTGDIINTETFRLLESLKKEMGDKNGAPSNYLFIFLGQVMIIFAVIFTIFLFIMFYRRELYNNIKKITFVMLIVVLFTLFASLTVQLKITSLYLIPFAIIAIIMKSFFDGRLAIFVYCMTIVLIGFFAPNSFEFVFMNLIVGVIAVFSVTNLYRRGKTFYSSAIIIATYSFVYIGISFYQEGNWQNIDLKNITYFAGNGLLVLSSIPLIFIFEKLFGFLSDATLLELSDTNQSLLRKLAQEAPGTFQHSIQVANLAEEAIFQIGGNALLVRTGALYHDIGKMENPLYFIENQTEGFNPHDKLEFEQSAEIIIGHVKIGIALAKKYKLPEQIIDFIRTHHGTTTVNYFYRSYLKKYPDSEVDVMKFTYPGPKPFSREMAVLMIADSVEAASRSLKDYSIKSINTLVEEIVNTQLKEEQFNDSNITFKEITRIKTIFKQKLRNIYHVRIEYPSISNPK